MLNRDIVVIGASAGGVSVLEQLVKSMPKDFPGSVFIVMHTPPFSPSKLPEILIRAGEIEAVHPMNGDKIKKGKIYVAPPDHHMLIEGNNVLIRKGPKENRFRPSIDALFRSAAYEYGKRVVGVILTGALDDGTSGLWTIKRLGGVAICQDLQEATFPEMPQSAINYVDVDYTVKVSEIGAILSRLVSEQVKEAHKVHRKEMERLALEVEIAGEDNAFEKGIMNIGDMAAYTCPSCHGALIMIKEGRRVRYRCHTGHAFTASALLAGITETVEETLWQAMRGLEETSMLLQHIGEHIMDSGDHEDASIFMKKANETADRARVIHDSVFKHERMSADLQYNKEEGKVRNKK
ncbi:chemotaxis protein CheB [Flammeovirgaceae bacterium 311]|nr:chemotaxis protein CheB [Flammeovirgaceae bacterium 311]